MGQGRVFYDLCIGPPVFMTSFEVSQFLCFFSFPIFRSSFYFPSLAKTLTLIQNTEGAIIFFPKPQMEA